VTRIPGILFLLAFTLQLGAQSATDNFKKYQQTIPGSNISFTMVPIPAGTFTMGSNASDKEKKADETPQRSISISAFWMASFEVSRDAFDVFYRDETVSQNSTVDAITRPSAQYVDLTWGMGKEGGFPVNSMSQYAALMYCRWLYNKTGIFYRLPTEAEWEYACRAGTKTTYFFGNDAKDLAQYAWFKKNSNNKYQRSGQKKPNPWGLYDILGNVSEWTLDHYDPNSLQSIPDKSKDPYAPFSAAKYPKALRGGGYTDDAPLMRSSNRIKSDPSWNKRDPQNPKSKWWLTEGMSVGFRLVRPLEQPGPEAVKSFFRQYLGK
jgi:formylglycine-generating enzyme required for sulfatase activity